MSLGLAMHLLSFLNLCQEMLPISLPLTEITVSTVLGTIARTQVGLEDNQIFFLNFCSALGSGSSFDLQLLSSRNIEILIDIMHVMTLCVVINFNLYYVLTFWRWCVN